MRGGGRPATGDETQAILHHWRVSAPNDRLPRLVKDATRAFLRALQTRLASRSVPLGHWRFLRVLWQQDGLMQRDLSRLVGVMEPTTVSALRAMERRGYIRRRQQSGDRKKNFVFLTAKGRALKNSLMPLADEITAIAVRGISAEHVAITRKTLIAVIENLARDEAETVNGGQRPAVKRATAKASTRKKAPVKARKRAARRPA